MEEEFKKTIKEARKRTSLNRKFQIITNVRIISNKQVFDLNPFLVDLKKMEYKKPNKDYRGINILTGRQERVYLKKILKKLKEKE